jgi:glycine hydroxymethyltransferase
LTGRQAEGALLDAGIVTNRNSVPADVNGAWYTSGVRIGTPALTTRGLDEADFDQVAELIVAVLRTTKPAIGPNGAPSKAKYASDTQVAARVRAECDELLAAHPLYRGLAV